MKTEKITPLDWDRDTDELGQEPDPVCCHFCSMYIDEPENCMAAWWENDDGEVYEVGAYCRRCQKKAENKGHLRDIHGHWAGWSAVCRVFWEYDKWTGTAARDWVRLCSQLEKMMDEGKTP